MRRNLALVRSKREEEMAQPISGIRTPLHPFFVGLGGALLIAALFTDYMYATNSLSQWANFSVWLITGGLVLALIATIFLVIDVALGRAGAIRWLDFGLIVAAAILSLVNVFVHTRDAWSSVVPTGITLSTIVTILLLAAGLRGWCLTAATSADRGERE
jgi:uncharacterized membrane protein